MDYRQLGRSDIRVSALCLGTMTYGEQNSEEEAFEQLDYAFAEGINFFDTAEMYAVPTREETYGRSEEILGNWVKTRGLRDKVVIATKIVGPAGGRFAYIRKGETRFNRDHISAALESSLRRLQTDYVDLYQLHWPDRSTNTFGKLDFERDPDEDMTPFEETLGALAEVVKAGKVRTVGLSNENPWGVMKFLQLADAGVGPRMASVQNPYSLLNRSFETRLGEIAIRENCGLLAYAPLGAGTLSGKYRNGQRPQGARLTLWPDNRRYQGAHAERAIDAYVTLAERHGLDPAQMALAFAVSRPFMTSAIMGATKMAQLRNNIPAAGIALDSALLDEIEDLHRVYTYPCP